MYYPRPCQVHQSGIEDDSQERQLLGTLRYRETKAIVGKLRTGIGTRIKIKLLYDGHQGRSVVGKLVHAD